MTRAPLVSVCIPVFQAEEFVRETLLSVHRQTLLDVEVICIDNASADRSVEEIEQLLQELRDPRFRLLRNETNLGMVGNWNRCLSEAQGKYVKLLMADDLLTPDCLLRQVEALEAHPTAVLATCARQIMNRKGIPIFKRSPLKRGGLIPGREVVSRCLRDGSNLIGEPTATLFPRALLARTGRFPDSIVYFTDLSLWLRLLTQGDVYCCRDVLCSFRVHGANATSGLRGKAVEDFKRVADEIEGYSSDVPRFDRRRMLRKVAFQSWSRSTVCSLLNHFA